MGFPVYVFCCFSFAAFNIFSLNLIFVRVLCVTACFSLALSCVELWASYTWVAVSFVIEVVNQNLLKQFLRPVLFFFFWDIII